MSLSRIIIIILIAVILCSCSASVSEEQLSLPTATNTVLQSSATPIVTTAIISATPEPTPSPSPTPIPQPLLGYKIGIDPGHQRHGNDEMERLSPYNTKEKKKVSLGTKGSVSGVREYVFNLDISFVLKETLESLGAEVFMTRTEHAVDISNKERAIMMNELKCDFWIRIHANWNEDENKVGISTLTPIRGCVSTHIHEESKLLSGLVQKNMIEATGAYDHGLSYRSTITGFCWSRIPVTLIECGYMSNADEDLLLQTEYYKQLLVDGIVQGMIEYTEGADFPIEYEYVPKN